MKGIQKISLHEIDLSDETFSVNFMPDRQRLRLSIEEMGLIQPVLLKRTSDIYQIVCGFRRISIFRELGKTEIESKVFEEKEMDDFRLFSLSLHDNLNTRGFNSVEKAIALDKLIHHFGLDAVNVVKSFLPLFSLEPDEKILNTYLFLARMEDEVKRYVVKEEVSRFNIRKLSALTSDDRRALIPLFTSLKLGENHLREILTLLEEISSRDLLVVKEIVHRPEIQAVLSQKELTPSQKTERVRRALTGLRYPRMREMEERFEKKRRELNLPADVSVRHQPFFEGKGLKIELQFETVEEYKSILSSLSSLAEKREFEEILKSI